ncbi:hypothetical protein GQ44DRAFT_676781 [Phaeosphaeriaceae sp. PMI808]|nr:hypothetical protein GQ44DRAFT_676781 [Phaeosphaeriaceae sp. PMI808]
MASLSRPALCRNESMQKYLLLSAQKEALQRRISLEIPFAAPMDASSPEFQSLSSSPDHSPSYASPYPATTNLSPKNKSIVGSGTNTNYMHTEESHKLAQINHQIVATLTELLNTESVRSDEKSRAWIQERLMEAEHQIRRQRRRLSSNSERHFALANAH